MHATISAHSALRFFTRQSPKFIWVTNMAVAGLTHWLTLSIIRPPRSRANSQFRTSNPHLLAVMRRSTLSRQGDACFLLRRR